MIVLGKRREPGCLSIYHGPCASSITSIHWILSVQVNISLCFFYSSDLSVQIEGEWWAAMRKGVSSEQGAWPTVISKVSDDDQDVFHISSIFGCVG